MSAVDDLGVTVPPKIIEFAGREAHQEGDILGLLQADGLFVGNLSSDGVGQSGEVFLLIHRLLYSENPANEQFGQAVKESSRNKENRISIVYRAFRSALHVIWKIEGAKKIRYLFQTFNSCSLLWNGSEGIYPW